LKLLRYGSAGEEKPAALASDGTIRDISGHVGDISGDFLGDEVLGKLRAVDLRELPMVPDDARIGPCVARPCNFIAVGLNYADHAAESGMPIPTEPILFSKAPNSIVGPNDDVVMPEGSGKLDWEVELAFVIGKRAYRVNEAEALEYVSGYCVCNDVSEREWQIGGTGQWLKGKSAPTFGPLGPWLVTRDEIADPGNLGMWLKVNGETVQEGSTATMIFKVPFLVSYISRFMELLPGDVVTTGTPPGVGMGFKPPRYLKPGDEMELFVEKLGRQKQKVVSRDS